MFQQESPYGFSLVETSLSDEILDYFQNIVVSNSDDVTTSQQNSLSSSSYSGTLSCSITEQQSHSPEKLSSLRSRDGSGDVPSRKRRRRTRSDKKIEDKEKQRMNHIAVERNRRRQMNYLLSILKSMMPLSYSQPNDQASIIEGTVNYLKKLEQLHQSLEARLKATKTNQSPNIFSDFFMFPQYSTATSSSSSSSSSHHEQLAVIADVEVTMVGRHANIKVLTKTQPRLLLKMINEFYSLGLSTLHLNLTTSKDMSLFTFSVKVETDCQLTPSVNEIANAVHEVVRRIIHKEC